MRSRVDGLIAPALLLPLLTLLATIDPAGIRPQQLSPDLLPGWELRPDVPGTMICRTPGGFDWIVETGSDERPASGRALEGNDHFINGLTVRFPGGGEDASFAYRPNGAAVPGRTMREIVFPAVEEFGIRIFRRLYIDREGVARWLDVFVNTGAANVTFMAVLENRTPVTRAAFSFPSAGDISNGEFFVTASPGSRPWLAHAGLGLEYRLASFVFDDDIDQSAVPGCPARRIDSGYEMILEPGEEACLLSFVLPAATANEAEASGRRISADPDGHTAWLSPSEKKSVRNFGLNAVSASNAPGIRLNTSTNLICWGVSPVQVEAWDDMSVVWMELTYWEDWDLPQGHTYYQHPLTTDGTAAQHLLYNICWDIPNSPRHSGGFWRLAGAAWDAEGQSTDFLTGIFSIGSGQTCTGLCQPSVVILEPSEPVSISFIQPAEGQQVRGLIPVQVEARSGVGIAEVKLFIDGAQVADWAPAPVPTVFVGNYDWDAQELELLSEHTLRAEVRNYAEETATTGITIILTSDDPASISILRPHEGQMVWGITPVELEARAGAGIAEVKLLVDGVRVAAWSPAPVPAVFVGTHDWNTLGLAFHSSHALRAEVRDQTGEIATTEIAVTATCVQTNLQGRFIRGFGFSSVLLDIIVANPDALPVDHYVLYKKTGSGDFQAYRTLPLTAFTGGRSVVGDSPVPAGGSFAYRLDAIAANGQVIGRSAEIVL